VEGTAQAVRRWAAGLRDRLQSQTNGAVTQQYAVLALVMLVSVGLFFAIDAMSPVSPSMLTVGY
jgi:nitrite reductase (NADH) large subunit